MSELSNRYQKIMKELQANIKNEEDKELVMSKLQELSMMFMDIIDRLTYITDLKIKDVEVRQKDIDNRINRIQKSVDGIENDIYEDDENYEFEIACPYCNYEFVTDINSDLNTEVECPECHNIIELDWNGSDEECEHDCSCCGHECAEEEQVSESEKFRKDDTKQNQKNNEEDEDM